MSDDNNKNSIEIKVITPNDNDNNEDNGDAPTLTDIKKLGWDDKDFVKSKLCNNEISDKDKSDILKDKPKVYIDEISNNQCVVIQSEHCIIFQNNDKSNSKLVKLMMLRRSHKDEKKYKIYSMEYNSNSGDLKLLHTHNIYSDETPRIYYDVNHFLVASSHSLISEWSHNHRFYEKSYNYEKNYYLKSNDYIVLNKKNKAEEALMVADYRRNSKLVVYSLERNIAVSSYEFKKKVYIKKVDFIYVKNDDIFSFANDENEIHKEEDNSEKQSTKGLFNDILTRYWKLTKEKVEDLSSLEDKVDKISLKYWESTIKKERKEDLEKFKHNIDKVNEVSLKEYWAKQKKKKEYLAKLKENEYLTKLENEINETNGLNQYWTSTTEKVKDLATTLEDIVNKINGVTSNQSTEKEDEISRIDDDISNQSTKKKEKEGLPKSEDEIDILEKYWTSEKSEKKEYLTKLENKIKRISDILNQSTRGKKHRLKNYEIYYMGQQLHKIYKNILVDIKVLNPGVCDSSKNCQTIGKLIKKRAEDLIANKLYENPIIKNGKNYKWIITHNKECQHINIRALNKNSNSGSEYDLSYDEKFIKCKSFDDRLILITKNYMQLFAVHEKNKSIYVRYIKSHNLSIESLEENIKSIEEDYDDSLYKKITSYSRHVFDISELESEKACVMLLIPFPGFMNYDSNYNFAWEMIKPESNIFVESENLEIYKHWNGKFILDYKWSHFGRKYHIGVSMIYIIFLLGFAIPTTSNPDDFTDIKRKKSLIVCIAIAHWLYYDTPPAIWMISLTNLLLDLRFMLLFRAFRSFGVYYAIIIGVAQCVFSFLLILFLIVLSFSHALHILLRPTEQYDLDAPTINDDPNNPWNLVDNYTIFTDNIYNTTTYFVKKPDDSVNMFAYFPTSMLAMYNFLTGDSSALGAWSSVENPYLVILVLTFSFLIVVYLMNLFIGLLSNEIEKNNTEEAFLSERAKVIREIELFYLFPNQRRWRDWFPDILCYSVPIEDVRKKINEIDNSENINTPFISRKVRDLVKAPEKCDLDQVKDKIEEIEKILKK
ncbi:10040_t:CDS:10 [Entrophospora sp. SA101]|nr:10040_t:CDS:10 [Entrophospora sp. SA101]